MEVVRIPALRLSAAAVALSIGLVVTAPQVDARDDHDDRGGSVVIHGGTVSSSTTVDISANGGTAIADASGGNNNVAIVAGRGGDNDGDGVDIAAAGNGGTANASANGGAVVVGDINSGGNQGNTIVVGNTGGRVEDVHHAPAKPVVVPAKPAPPKAAPAPPKKVVPTVPTRTRVVTVPTGGRDRGGRAVGRLPSTGVGETLVRGQTGGDAVLLAAGALLAMGAAGVALRRRFA